MQAKHAQKTMSQELETLYYYVRNYTEEICEPLEVEDYIPQPAVDVSPPKWNINGVVFRANDSQTICA